MRGTTFTPKRHYPSVYKVKILSDLFIYFNLELITILDLALFLVF